ncbi:integration host factor, actinobacterial type [Amycolatopsis anabasis]|uniref:integration host factor, actinobacterial type n=1 Tax=Amycolatopsis anabasis TaxID=1840409 RepID=UPI00131E1008|nr:integration host factor, actinobacterial type [Amycolatopsis anabasis]
MPVPHPTAEQRQSALLKAAEVRRRRAEILRELKAGELGLLVLLEQATRDPVVGRIKVSVALRHLPRIGAAKASRFMAEAEITSDRTLAKLDPLERTALLDALARACRDVLTRSRATS